MILLIDVGNSRFKWCGLRDGELDQVCAREYSSQDRAQAVLTALEAVSAPRRIVIASVLGDAFRQEFTRLAAARHGDEPEFVISPRSGHGIELAYDAPESFGADRFCALVAAHRRFHEPCIVVDCGTAVTIDALSADGQHLGGLIVPGLELMRRSLIEHTARISLSSHGDNNALFGRSTEQGVKVGTLRALAAGIDRIVADMTAHIIRLRGVASTCNVITGGAAAYLLPCLATEYELAPELVLQGLAIIAEPQFARL
ncbi:MAG: type III pantothenate kinase [Gammaproteobacteria bacterium]